MVHIQILSYMKTHLQNLKKDLSLASIENKININKYKIKSLDTLEFKNIEFFVFKK